jgi:nicotinamidase-related amidase
MADTRKVLIVVDVQNDFITGALRNEEAIKRLPNIVNLVKTSKFDDIYLTMDTHDETYPNSLEGKKLPVKHCIEGTEGHKLAKELVKALKDFPALRIFKKNTFGAVHLARELRDLVDLSVNQEIEFTIVGFCTDICVVSNALLLRAFAPNAKITVFKDCCAGTNEDNHEAALKTMESCQIDVALSFSPNLGKHA